MAYAKKQSHGLKIDRYPFNLIKRIILSVIAITIVVVAVSLISSLILEPKRQTEARITELTKAYYEDFVYQELLNASDFSGDPQKSLEKYTESGLAPVTLRQLILVNHEKNAEDARYLANYCDEDGTVIRFYPEPPFAKTSYHYKIDYACKF